MIVILVRVQTVGRLLRNLAGNTVVTTRILGFDRGRRYNYLGPKSLKRMNLLIAHLIGHNEDALVALHRCGDSEPHACVSRSGFNDGSTGLDHALTLGVFDDRDADTVFDGSSRVEELNFGQNGRLNPLRDTTELHQRSIANGLEDVLRDPG